MQRLFSRLGLDSLQRFSIFFACIAIFCGYIFRLRSLTLDNALASERATMHAAQTWHGIWHQLLNAPYFIVVRGVEYTNRSVISGRLVSIAFGLVAIALVYYVVHKWLGWKFAAIAVWLFGTNSYVLHAVRLADPYVLQLVAGVALLALFCGIYKQASHISLITWAVGIPLLLYVPGTVLLVAMTMAFSWRKLWQGWRTASKKLRGLIGLVSVVLTAPLVYYLLHSALSLKQYSVVQQWLGIDFSSDHVSLAKRIVQLPLHTFWHTNGTAHPVAGAGHLPAIALSMTLLFILGLYVAAGRMYDLRWRLIVSLVAGGWLVSVLGVINVAFVVPLVYVLAVVGLAYLLNEWYKVFPRNPVARGIGFSIVLAVVILSSIYNLRAYFVAWAHNPVTIQAYACPTDVQRTTAACRSNLLQ